MKKKVLLAIVAVLALCGCSKTIPTLSNGSEAMVSFEDGSMISVDEVYKKLKDSYATQVLIDMVDKKILEEKYKDKLDEASEYADSNLESIKTYYQDEDGNYDEAALLSAIQQYYGYSSLDEFKSSLNLSYLRNLAIEDYVKTTIKDKEIEKYYEDEIVGDREIKHIQIIPDVKDSMTTEEKEAAEEEALNEAKSLIAKLKKGEKFDDLAKASSDDEDTKDKGGSLGKINKGDFGSEAFDKEAFALEVGKFSETPVKTDAGYEIILVVSEDEKKSLDDVRDEVIDDLVDQKLAEDNTLQITGIKELRKEYGVDIIDSDVQKAYNKYMDNLYDSALQSNTENATAE